MEKNIGSDFKNLTDSGNDVPGSLNILVVSIHSKNTLSVWEANAAVQNFHKTKAQKITQIIVDCKFSLWFGSVQIVS